MLRAPKMNMNTEGQIEGHSDNPNALDRRKDIFMAFLRNVFLDLLKIKIKCQESHYNLFRAAVPFSPHLRTAEKPGCILL